MTPVKVRANTVGHNIIEEVKLFMRKSMKYQLLNKGAVIRNGDITIMRQENARKESWTQQ